MRPSLLSVAGLSLLSLAACSPTFNWRDVRPEGSELQALMPCKPDEATRAVPLGNQPTDLHMLSCDAGGLTFALAWALLPDADAATRALPGWRQASLAALRADATPGETPALVQGADQAWGLQARGRDHRGEPVLMEAVHFRDGARVYQAAVYGKTLDDEVTGTFFEGLRLP